MAIVNHELGHIALNHYLYKTLIFILIATVFLSLFYIVYGEEDILRSFGFSNNSPSLYIFIFMAFYDPIDFFTQILTKFVNRMMEF